MQKRTIRKKQTLFYRGEVPSVTYRILDGVARGYSILDNGEERTVALFGKGDYFPVGTATATAQVALFFYETVTQCEMMVLNNHEVQAAILEHPKEEVERLALQYVSTMMHVNALSQNSAKHRVAYILQYLGARFGERLTGNVMVKIQLRLTQQEIARLCGLTRETTALEISKLRKANVVSVKNKFYIIHEKKLLRLLDEEHLSRLSL